jgi:hypothetical protein
MAAAPGPLSVIAVSPHGWLVTVEGRHHLVRIDDADPDASRRTVRVDDVVVAVSGVAGREWRTALPLGIPEASMEVRMLHAGVARNIKRSLRGLGANRTLQWFVYGLTVGGAGHGRWVETIVGFRTDHWAFGLATAGLPCCGVAPDAHDDVCAWQAPRAPHQDPLLEILLPATVSGQRLLRWSVVGWEALGLSGPIEPAEMEEIEADLADRGLAIDDASQAFAGRAGAGDPAYSVLAVRLTGSRAADLPPWVGVADEATASTGWTTIEIADRVVRRGTPEMVGQDEHVRGTPYAYDRGDVRFVVTSDRDDWVEAALRQLP